MKEKLINLIEKMGCLFSDFNFEKIQSKVGVHVYRVFIDKESYILKYFENQSDAREINNYKTLESLGVPTIKYFGNTQDAILLEDIKNSKKFRLGKPEDLKDECVARLIARWYKELHTKGNNIGNLKELYSEYDSLTYENLILVMEKSETAGNPIWNIILNNLDKLVNTTEGYINTLTYNDFFWTNLAVSSDCKSVLMFDFNLLGRGYAYADIRNVCSALSGEAASAFMNEYGPYEKKEKIVDEVIADLHSLIEAFQRDSFPSWADSSLNNLKSGRISEKMHIALDMYGS